MFSSSKIQLFWWDERRFHKLDNENYGDLLSKYIVENVSGKSVQWRNPKSLNLFNKNIFFGIGSILAHVNKNCIVWGSGIISKSIPVKNAKFLAVRGPQTREYLLSLGYKVPAVYGDPAILLPLYYSPIITKKYKIGIIPHKEDLKQIQSIFNGINGVKIIPLATNDIEYTTNQILECEAIISSSLHGLIVPHAYGIPAVWQKFSDNLFGDDVKFLDYFESVNILPYIPRIRVDFSDSKELELLINEYDNLPSREIMNKLQNVLLEAAPF